VSGERKTLLLALAVLCEADEVLFNDFEAHCVARVGERHYTIAGADWDELSRRGWLRATGEERVEPTMAGRSAARRFRERFGIRIKGA
jgi:hypothetical protein